MLKSSAAFTAGILMISVLFFSCETSPYPDYKKSELGYYYRFFNQDEKGAKPALGEVVMMKISYRSSTDSLLFNSSTVNPENGTIDYLLPPPAFKGGVEDAIMSMSIGDSASFLISADSVYLKTFMAKELPPYIEKGSMLTFNIKLTEIKSKEKIEAEKKEYETKKAAYIEQLRLREDSLIKDYISKNNIAAPPSSTGLYFIEKKGGKGKKVLAGDTIQLHYTGSFLDGTIFDTSEGNAQPATFVAGDPRLIKGFNEALLLMNRGDQALALIPSSIGYGEEGGGGRIPPYSPLLFKIEIIK